MKRLESTINEIVARLTDEAPIKDFYPAQPTRLPSVQAVKDIAELGLQLFFPGFYTEHRSDNLFNAFNTGSLLFRLSDLLKEQCLLCLCFCMHR